MPQQATNSQNDDYTAIDPKQNPIGFVFQNKDALGRMDPEKAVRFVDMVFRRYALPKYQKVNQQRPLDDDEVERLRLQFAARMLGIPGDQETKLKEPEVKRGVLEKGAAALEAGGAGVIGGLRTIEELREKLQKIPYAGKVLQYDPVNMGLKKLMTPAGKVEGKAYEDAKDISPSIASIAAGVGHQIPAAVATHGVESALPAAGKAASLGMKVLSGGGRGVAGGAMYEASRPGGDPASGAAWGGALGAAFPLLGKLFGLGRSAKAAAPKVAEAAGQGTPAATAAPTEAKNLGDVADKAAKEKFGKSFKDLTPSEKAKMPQYMKEEIAKQRAQQAATKKAEQAAAKAGREAEETAKRAEKAAQATKKAEAQAAKRAAVPSTTPVQKQAVAAKAAEENPAAAKIMGSVEGESEMERARRGGGKETPLTPEQIKGNEERQLEKEAEEALKKSGMGGGKVSEVKKVAEGETGPKVRAKGGKPASPAQQAADRERIAKKRELAKGEEFGKALEKHAQEMAGKHTAGSIGLMHIPELEDAMKEFPNGELFLKGFQKLRKAGRITDEIYLHEMKEWLFQQFEGAA